MKEILIFWALCSLVGDLLAKRSPPLIQQVAFLSTNFENILTWEHGKEISPGTIYDVQYKTNHHKSSLLLACDSSWPSPHHLHAVPAPRPSEHRLRDVSGMVHWGCVENRLGLRKVRYGATWQNKSECQNITQLFCNLTRETENYTERYHARVRAVVPNCCVSDWVTSPRFYPKEDTVVGDPEVKYIPNVQSIKFIIQPPYTPLRDEANRTLTVEDIFSRFDVIQYQIIIFCQKTLQKWKKMENNKEFEIAELDSDSEYNGTIHIKYLDKISKPHTFRVRTLPDHRWLTYLFGVVAFMALLIFGMIYYLIHKYIKQYTTQQPMSLDFKGMSHFQPLTLTVERILVPHDFSKPFQMDPEMKPEVLEHQMVFSLPDRVYQQQAEVTSFPCVAAPRGQADDTGAIGYAPQVSQKSAPHTPDDKRSTLTYGVCIEGTSCANKANASSLNQMTKPVAVRDGLMGDGQTKVQKQSQNERGLWGNLVQKEPVLELEEAGQTQLLLLLGGAQGRPQPFPSLLQERVPAILGERTGRYKRQPVEPLPAALAVGQMATSGGDSPLSPAPHSSSSVGTSNTFSRDPGLVGPWTGCDSLAWANSQWPPSRCQTTEECLSRPSAGLKREPDPLSAPPESSDSPQDNLFLPGLFRDLELKLQWDHEADETVAIC